MSETSIMKAIQIKLTEIGLRLFRNNVGVLKDRHGNYVQYGLCVGSSDLIGWRTVKIDPGMIGKEIAVFVALEVKKPGGYITVEQSNFLGAVKSAGGIGAVVYSVEEAINAIK